ncbi:acetate kinase [Microbulbifer flavimaris]|uniref:Acetate kinase n=1 Tax=Microbulbifer flavimaris TaxID=1781068 RepID=A0ABX4I389_9GAMM|nr:MULTISPECIES: acetate kinase [Microbulbifer]KUJ84718.1 acetate kinase [Microbulbifer sp. ZGT114]PCO06811.1 acetate kinase [Microbulbifer flavimaris]
MAHSRQVLIFNTGSSSLKFAVVDPGSGEASLSGIADSLGGPEPALEWKIRDNEEQIQLSTGANHGDAIRVLVEEILAGLPELHGQLVAVGHRVVHGGEEFADSALIDSQVIEAIEKCAHLAPLHNPAALAGIRAAKQAFPELPQVAVFDTAFHQTLPQHAFLYALPYQLYREHKIRRYGMHGTSHKFVSERAAALLQRPLSKTNTITAHLGNGASITAVKGGVSVDTSMGMTPLEGLVMGSRCGDIDPGVLVHLGDALEYSPEALNQVLNRESGLLGISELSNDCRELEQAATDGHRGALLALEIFCYRLAKYVAAYTLPLRRVHGLVFTGGIGENSSWIRARTMHWLGAISYELDSQQNEQMRYGAEGLISRAGTPPALVIPTNEEWVIARDAARLVEGRGT